MSVAEILSEIPKLTLDEKLELARELDVDGALWDAQIEADAKAGRLDFLFEEALEEHRRGETGLSLADGFGLWRGRQLDSRQLVTSLREEWERA